MRNDHPVVSRNKSEGIFVGRAKRRTRRQFELASGYTRSQPGVVTEYLGHNWAALGDSCVWWVQVVRDGRRHAAPLSEQDAYAVRLVNRITGLPEPQLRAMLEGWHGIDQEG